MKKAIVIGATSGIGKSISEILIQNNYTVGITGRRIERLQSMKNKCHQTILEDFNIQNTSNSYFDYYETILNGRKNNSNTFYNPFKESILDLVYFPSYLSLLIRKLKKYAFN